MEEKTRIVGKSHNLRRYGYVRDIKQTHTHTLFSSVLAGSMFSAMFESIPYIMLFLIPFDVVLLISGGLLINLA